MSDATPLTPDEERSLREGGLIQSPCTMARVWATIDAERAAREAADAKLEPTKWGHVKSAINEMRTAESAIEDATAKRIAEALHSDRCPIIGGTADIQRVGEWMIRGDWRKPDAGSR